MSSTPPTGLLPSEVAALRQSAGISTTDFATAFGVSSDVVERWEAYGLPTGPTALAVRLVAASMEFDFPTPTLGKESCEICAAPASENFANLPVCPACHRDPRRSMEALGFELVKSHSQATAFTGYSLRLPSDRQVHLFGTFLSEGLSTLLTKLFKNEPQIGEASWDDAVYVQWIEPGLEALDDPASRHLIKTLVSYGMLEVEPGSISVQHVPGFRALYDEEILLLCGLLASRLS